MKKIIKYAVFYLVCITTTLSAHSLDTESIITINTEDDLKNLLENNLGPSAISFHMDQCSWCKKMNPIFESLANNDQFEHITFYRVNGPLLKAHTHVQNFLTESIDGYPAILFMNKGKLVDKQVGAAPQNVIIQKLQQLHSSSDQIKKNKRKVKKN